MSDQQEIEFIDGDSSYPIAIVPQPSGGKLFTRETKPWEPDDGSVPFRVPLHPWSGGLGPNRIRPVVTFAGNLANRPSMVYAKANADASNETYLTAPPAIKDFATPAAKVFSFYNDQNDLFYGATYYGNTSYMGSVTGAVNFFLSLRNFNNKAYFAGGQYLYSVNSNFTFTQVKDFGTGKIIHDIEVFNNELVIAMGETVKLWTMDTAETFTQATDATYAIALGREGDKLWRAESTNKLSNCITAPRTLTSYSPASPNQYAVGDSSWPIIDIQEALGSIAVFKADGVYFPDYKTEFHNQTPQLAVYPDPDNGKGSFIAWGYLFVPSVVGLLRVDVGESIAVGPELSQRPDFRFRVRAGVEWNRHVYLLCTDEANESYTFICKMMRKSSEIEDAFYVYHEWLRLDNTDKGYVLIVYTGSTNPIMVAGHGPDLHYWKMGRGGGADVDDPLYEMSTSFEVEVGKLIASSDLSVEIDVQGVKLVGKQIEGATVIVSYDIDETGSYTNMLDNQDGSGSAPITDNGRFVATRYAEPNSIGHVAEIKISGTLPLGTLSPNRTEIDEAWLFGVAHSETVELINVSVIADSYTRVRGLRQGLSSGELIALLSQWQRTKKILEMKLPDYYNDRTVRIQVVSLTESNIQAQQQGRETINSSTVQLILRKVDFGG